MADEEIPWEYKHDRLQLGELLKNESLMHLPANKSSINWGGIPDSLVEKMKEQDKMPKSGINNRIMTAGPWEPSWFESYNQKFMPNNTEFIYYDYDKQDQQVALISKEMEKFGIHGA